MITKGLAMGQSITRQARWVAVSAAAGLVLLAACAPPSDDDDGSVAESGTVKVGFLSPVTGPVAAAGIEMREGWELYWQEHGETVGEITVETIFEDDAGNPDTALTKAKRLIEEEQVDVIVGPLLANTALAVADYVTRAGIPSLQPVTAADDLTQRKHHPLLLRAGSYTGSQMNFPGGQWAYEQGHRRAITLCPDYAFGWESCAGFVRAFTAAGGEIVDQLWFPLGTQDFSPYVTEMRGTDADIAFVTSAGGADGPTFVRTYHDFGLTDQLPLLTNCCAMDQATLRDVGELAEGIHSVSYWAEGRDSPAVQGFVQAYKQAYGKLPSLNVAGGYLTAEVLARALETAGGEATAEELIDAASSIRFEESLYGPLRYDEYNNPVGPVYIRVVERNSDGEYWNVPVETYEDVSQFWTFDPEEYLQQPPYDREHTGQ